MSQVLGKPQLEDEDDDEEDELVGLADYGDGPDSSDADPDSGTEEGGERGVSRPSSPRASSARTQSLPCVFPPPAGPGARAADLERIQESGVAGWGWGWGGAPEERPQAAKWGIPGAGGDGEESVGRAEGKRLGRRNVRSLAPSRASTSPTSHPSSPQGLGFGEGREPPGSPQDLSLNAAVEAGVRCRG